MSYITRQDMAQKKQEIIIDANDEKKINQAIARIDKKIELIRRGYIEIVGDIAYLNETQAYLLNGHKSIYSFCSERFGISRGMTHNLLSIYARYGENYKLTDEASELSVRQLLAQIKEEKKALECSDSSSAGPEEKKKERVKHETILDFNFKNADEWHGEDLLEKLRDEIGDSLIIPEGAKIIITIKT